MQGCQLFIYFVVLRVASIYVVQTSYVPDEYWQSLEVAHYAVYENGHLTWEWTTALRSYLYPFLFTLLYRILRFLHLDSRSALIICPRMMQACITAIGDVHIVWLCQRFFGVSAANWTIFSLSTSWFLFYCASRTLSNTMEMAVTAIGLYYFYFLHNKSYNKSNTFRLQLRFLCLMGGSIALRPTSVVQWFPLGVLHLLKFGTRVHTWFALAVAGLTNVVLLITIDFCFYDHFVFSPWNFIKFNVINDQGSFYGSHPWHWYLSQGFPTIMGFHLLPFVLQLFKSWKSSMFALIGWHIFIYSFFSHKEFRFILPILPVCMCLVGKYLAGIVVTPIHKGVFVLRRSFGLVLITMLVLTNAVLVVYTGQFHQRGTLDVIQFLAETHELGQKMDTVSFLMPCHSTPLYSHLHHNISTKILGCEPNLANVDNYVDEADRFFQNPISFLEANYSEDWTYLVMFDSLQPTIAGFLLSHNYTLCARFFHAHFVERRTATHVSVYCKR